MFKRLKHTFLILLYLLLVSFFYYWLNSNQHKLNKCVGIIEEEVNQAINCFLALKQEKVLTKSEEIEADFRLLYCYHGNGDFENTLKQFNAIEPYVFIETAEDILPVYLYLAVKLKEKEPEKAKRFFQTGTDIIEKFIREKEVTKVSTPLVMNYLLLYCEEFCTTELKSKVGSYFTLFSKISKIPVEFEQRLKKELPHQGNSRE